MRILIDMDVYSNTNFEIHVCVCIMICISLWNMAFTVMVLHPNMPLNIFSICVQDSTHDL